MEGREPPHIHVAHAGRYAKFWLEPVSVAEGVFGRTRLLRFAKSQLRTQASSWRNGMSTLGAKAETLAVDVSCSRDALSVTLSDGRVVSVPLVWFPRLAGASERERSDWELIGGGIGIHWEAVDEDISVASLLRPENFMRLPDEPGRRAARRKLRG